MKTRKAYLEYLSTQHWADLRGLALSRDRYRCTRCQSTQALQVHHKFYRDLWTDTLVGDLETLCRNCHEKEHDLNQPKPLIRQTHRQFDGPPPIVFEIRPKFESLSQLVEARSRGEITRQEFKRIKKASHWTSPAASAAYLRKSKKKIQHKPDKWHYQKFASPTGKQSRWHNRSNSSN